MLRRQSPQLDLGPDGKVQIAMGEESTSELQCGSLEVTSCAMQQQIASDKVALHRAVRLAVPVAESVPKAKTAAHGGTLWSGNLKCPTL